MSTCLLYVAKKGEISEKTLDKGVDVFIYSFIGMMGLIVIQLIVEAV